MNREPVPGASLPACFGLTPGLHDACPTCDVRDLCRETNDDWSTRTALSTRAQMLMQRLRWKAKATDLLAVYSEAYRDAFGRKAWKLSQKSYDVMRRAKDALDEYEDIHWPTFVFANMVRIRPQLPKMKTKSFFPGMLRGEKARGRYNAYLRQTNRRVGSADHIVEGARSEFRRGLYLSELALGDEYISRRLNGEDLTLGDAVLGCDTLDEHWLRAHDPTERSTFDDAYGFKIVQTEIELAQLRAACDLCERYEHKLADRVSAEPFTWEGLADFLKTRITIKHVGDVNLDGIPGMRWGGK